MAAFDDALAVVLRHEGGYVDHPADPGGATNRGITQRAYNRWRNRRGLDTQPVRAIGQVEVRAIYEADYWRASGADALPMPLALLHFDAYVNHTPATAQRFLRESGGDPKRYLALREVYFRQLAERRPASRVFLRGWLNRVQSLASRLASPGGGLAVAALAGAGLLLALRKGGAR